MPLTNRSIYHFGEFQLKTTARVLERQGVRVPLGSKAFEVLTHLVMHTGEVVTKDELLKAVWPNSFVEEQNLTQQIASLRKALGDKSTYITTVPGRGYQFTEAVRAMMAAVPPSLLEETSEDVVHAMRTRTHVVIEESSRLNVPAKATKNPTRLVVYAASAVVLILMVWVGWRWFRLRHGAPHEYRQVVVSDFINTTGDAAFDHILKRALQIDLEQSPYIDVLSDRETANTLQKMGRQSDTALTIEVAREVCERTNRQVLLAGGISSVGSEYLLTLEATDCSTGKQVAGAKAEVKTKLDILRALDSVAEHVRSGLGESAESVESYRVPIAQATTSSLEALRVYSVGESMMVRTGKEEAETLPMFQRAVELDPQFAMAYVAVATDYYNLNEYSLAVPYYQKAFDLSGQVSEKERLYIRAHYYADSKKDVEQGLKEYRLWAETYPRDWGPWLDIASNDIQLGQYQSAVEAGEQALKLQPARAIVYSVLARSYKCAGRFDDAKRIGQLARDKDKFAYGLNATLFEIAFSERDQKAITETTAWMASHPDDWYLLTFQASAAASVGRYKDAVKFYNQAYAIAKRENLSESADNILLQQAQAEAAFGWPSEARATLGRLAHPAPDNRDLMLLRAQLGDTTDAQRFLAANEAKSGSATLMAHVYLPQAHAVLAVQHRKPLEAITALETARLYELADYTVPIQRAEAYLQAKQAGPAIVEYKKVLANPGVNAISPQYPLTHLGLARAYAMSGDLASARAEYESFLSAWKDADPNLPVLISTKEELAKLGH
ncbi:MAG TPA: winged helix-turn-helix domain-containing protein [Granulicella sp.]